MADSRRVSRIVSQTPSSRSVLLLHGNLEPDTQIQDARNQTVPNSLFCQKLMQGMLGELVYPPSPTTEPPTYSSETTARRHKRNLEANPNWRPRPMNAFMLYRRHYAQNHKTIGAASISKSKTRIKPGLSSQAGAAWKALAPIEREKWHRMAMVGEQQHKVLNPDYVYRPRQRRTTKRRNTDSTTPPPHPRLAHAGHSNTAQPTPVFRKPKVATKAHILTGWTGVIATSATGVVSAYASAEPVDSYVQPSGVAHAASEAVQSIASHGQLSNPPVSLFPFPEHVPAVSQLCRAIPALKLDDTMMERAMVPDDDLSPLTPDVGSPAGPSEDPMTTTSSWDWNEFLTDPYEESGSPSSYSTSTLENTSSSGSSPTLLESPLSDIAPVHYQSSPTDFGHWTSKTLLDMAMPVVVRTAPAREGLEIDTHASTVMIPLSYASFEENYVTSTPGFTLYPYAGHGAVDVRRQQHSGLDARQHHLQTCHAYNGPVTNAHYDV